MVKQEDPELTSFHRHTKITIYRTTTYENDLKTNRKDFLQLKIKNGNYKLKLELENVKESICKENVAKPERQST